jgi:replicative DNA helicase
MPTANNGNRLVQRAIGTWLATHGNAVEGDAPSKQRPWLSSEEFANIDFTREWAVKHTVVLGQPGVVGGPRKGLKTSVVCDLLLSMASGKPFLNHVPFCVPRRLRVAFLSGESGEAAIKDTALRVCQAKGVSLAATRVMWGFDLPKLSNPGDMTELRERIVKHRPEVIFIDPTYLCLLKGNVDVQAASMFDMGPLLADISELCLDAGATPLLVHHYRKSPVFRNGKQFGKCADPPELEDLAFAGFGEFARQWLLLSRRVPFDPDVGHHALWMSVGGSAGHAGLYGVDVNEGRMDEKFQGRHWEPRVRTLSELMAAKREEGDHRGDERTQQTRTKRRRRLLEALRKTPEGRPLTALARLASLDNVVAELLLKELVTEGSVEECERVCASGRSKRSVRSFRLARTAVDDDDENEAEKETGNEKEEE